MSTSTLLFVHGTGVRSESLIESLTQIRSKVAKFKLPCKVESCEWGDVLGIDFEGLSLPSPPVRSADEDLRALRWEYLQVDPTFELRLWLVPPSGSRMVRIGETSSSKDLWDLTLSVYVRDFEQHIELKTLLRTYGIEEFFLPAWTDIVATRLPSEVFATAGSEVSAVSRVFAEAVVARMMQDAASAKPSLAIPPLVAEHIVTVMLFDWDQSTKGVGDLFLRIFGSATKSFVRPLRARTSRIIAPAIGDILNYQSHGEQIRKLIGTKIQAIPTDVFILAHSLGGVACFELLASARSSRAPELPTVRGLVTVGSQVPLLYELGALRTLPKNCALPTAFPPWLNLYDPNDLLSYCADRLFPVKPDKQVDSMLPPLQAHSAYWKLDTVWEAIDAFVKRNSFQELNG